MLPFDGFGMEAHIANLASIYKKLVMRFDMLPCEGFGLEDHISSIESIYN